MRTPLETAQYNVRPATVVIWLLAITDIIGWYGAYANVFSAYDRGFSEGSSTAQRQAYDKGEAAGRTAGYSAGKTESNTVYEQRFASMQQELRDKYQDALTSGIHEAYNAGMAAEAKAIIDHDMRMVAGNPEVKK